MNKLDRYDLRILAELQRDARISNQELAERIGLSASPCSRRVKQLEDDGYIARHYNQVTNFGKFMDPLADKVLVMAAMCYLVEIGQMPGWCLAIVLLREFAVSGMRLVAVEQGRVIAAAWSGKVKTASTMVCLCAMLLNVFGAYAWFDPLCNAVIVLTTAYSGIEYFIKNADVFREPD